MEPTWNRAAAIELDFMERVEARVEAAEEFFVPEDGRHPTGRARRDDEFPHDLCGERDRELSQAGIYDPDTRERLPFGARARWVVRSGGLFGGRELLEILVAVVHPFADLARGLGGRPRDAAAAEGLFPSPSPDGPPRVLAVLSTSGWRGEAKATEKGHLFEPVPGGGYRRFGDPQEAPPAYLALESEAELTARVVSYVGASRLELVLRGISARRASRELGVPRELVDAAFLMLAAEDEFLALSRGSDDLTLRRA